MLFANAESGNPLLSRRIKHLALLIFAQTVCVGVGLWIHHHYATASVRRSVEDATWSRLRATGDRLNAPLPDVSAERLVAEPALREPVETIMQPTRARQPVRVFVTDGAWHIALADTDRTLTPPSMIERTSWTPFPEPEQTHRGPLRGRLETGAGPYFALAYPLDHDAHLVIGYPEMEIEAQVAALTVAFPGAAVVTLLWTCALLGITVYMIVSRFCDHIKREREQYEAESLQRMESLVRMRDAIVFGLAKLAESRDPETGDHLERMSIYATTLASTLRHHPDYTDVVTPAFVRLIGISSVLHDIGKVGIEDAILLKPGPLDDAERDRMQAHTQIGSDCLLQIERRLGSSNFLQMAREIVQHHHERWDGSGYPRGLAGEEIPLSARIVAIADVYDALSSRRIYKGPYAHEQCLNIIRNESGKAFDPQLVDIWLTIEARFRDIARQYWSEPAKVDPDETRPADRGADLVDVGPILVGAGVAHDHQGEWE